MLLDRDTDLAVRVTASPELLKKCDVRRNVRALLGGKHSLHPGITTLYPETEDDVRDLAVDLGEILGPANVHLVRIRDVPPTEILN